LAASWRLLMSVENPYEKLGIAEDASFEEIQDARNRMCQAVEADGTEADGIEAAYDAILMERLRLRQEGRIQVPEGVRYPERTVEPPASGSERVAPDPAESELPEWMQGLLDTPSRLDLLIAGGIYATFAILTLANLSGGSLGALSAQSWVLTAGFAAAAYLLCRKELRFWRSLLLAAVGLFVGLGLGVLLAPVAANGLQTEYFASLVALFFLWAIASFLR
ncbi:MAG: CPP1-like family protein, partial [Cyanobacteria bacterium J06641_5]